jgi:hypothetical protein
MSALGVARKGRELSPVRAKGRWIAWGLALQVIGVGIPASVAIRRAHESGLGRAVTHYTVRLVWHEMLRSGADVALIILGVVLFVAGAVLLARPFVRRPLTLVVAVPLAALAGLALFGVVALLCAAVIALASGSGDVGGADWLADLLPGDWPGRRRRK